MSQRTKTATDKMSVGFDELYENHTGVFQRYVHDLQTLKLRGDEAVKKCVAVIRDFQEYFGKSEKALKQLADEVGVTTRTFYRWIREVNPSKPRQTKAKVDKSPSEKILKYVQHQVKDLSVADKVVVFEYVINKVGCLRTYHSQLLAKTAAPQSPQPQQKQRRLTQQEREEIQLALRTPTKGLKKRLADKYHVTPAAITYISKQVA